MTVHGDLVAEHCVICGEMYVGENSCPHLSLTKQTLSGTPVARTLDLSKLTLSFFKDPPGAGLFSMSEQTIQPYPELNLSPVPFHLDLSDITWESHESTVEQRTLADGTVVESILPIPYISPTAPRKGSLGPLYAELDFSLSIRLEALQLIGGLQESCFNQHAQWEQVLFQPEYL